MFLVCAAAQAVADQQTTARQMLASVGERSGLCLHVGFRDVNLTMQISDGGKYLVHGISRDPRSIEEGRKQIRRQGLSGAVSLEHHGLDRLPHADNLANLLIAEDVSASFAAGKLLDEILRVLRPGGTAYIAETILDAQHGLSQKQFQERLAKSQVKDVSKRTIGSGGWLVFHKPRPGGMDEWTHRRYDATRNAVSQDQVDVPSGVRWVAGPNWPTGNRKRAVAGVVASQDRLVYVFDDLVDTEDGPKRQKTLVARDAFNGLLLWKRLASNSGSPILIHEADRIYTVVEDRGPLVALDATSGKVVQTYDEAGGPEEVFYLDGRLLVRSRSEVGCLDAQTGKLLWEHAAAISDMIAGDGHVYVQGRFRTEEGERITGITALDLSSGRPVWRSDSEKWPGRSHGAKLALYQDGILVFGGNGNHAISAKDGSYLWSYEYPTIGHGGSYYKVVHMDGLLWVHSAKSKGPDGKDSYAWEGLDPQTGKMKKRLPHGNFKHRCMWDVATEKYILCGSMDFVGLQSQEHTHFTAARVSCTSGGAIPANGLVYTFPHACGCYPMLRGFMGLAAEAESAEATAAAAERHEQGPAWPGELAPPAKTKQAWAMYRADAQRSGSTPQEVPANLNVLWSRQLSDVEAAAMREQWDMKDHPRLTSAVVSDGVVFAAVGDRHELFALDADTGETRWIFTAGGRIDCPPTIYRGLCLLGARDGYVYCLRASDGELVWRYRAAPHARRIVAYGQLESAWPVVGGVLVHDGLAYFVAGRHGTVDGGVHVYAAQPVTGKIVWHRRPDGFNTAPDVMVARGDFVHMSDWQFDAKTGEDRKSSSDVPLRSERLSLLNDAWYKRPIALRHRQNHWLAHKIRAQMLTFNETALCGFHGVGSVSGGDGKMSGNAKLFVQPLDEGREWSVDFPLGTQIKGMALAGDTLLVAGRMDGFDDDSHALRAVSLRRGQTLAEISLAEPLVHDCLSVAGGRIYLATERGRIICLGGQ